MFHLAWCSIAVGHFPTPSEIRWPQWLCHEASRCDGCFDGVALTVILWVIVTVCQELLGYALVQNRLAAGFLLPLARDSAEQSNATGVTKAQLS